MASNEGWKVRLDQALHQPGFFTDILAKLEDKSKVPRLFIVLGKCDNAILYIVHCTFFKASVQGISWEWHNFFYRFELINDIKTNDIKTFFI